MGSWRRRRSVELSQGCSVVTASRMPRTPRSSMTCTWWTTTTMTMSMRRPWTRPTTTMMTRSTTSVGKWFLWLWLWGWDPPRRQQRWRRRCSTWTGWSNSGSTSTTSTAARRWENLHCPVGSILWSPQTWTTATLVAKDLVNPMERAATRAVEKEKENQKEKVEVRARQKQRKRSWTPTAWSQKIRLWPKISIREFEYFIGIHGGEVNYKWKHSTTWTKVQKISIANLWHQRSPWWRQHGHGRPHRDHSCSWWFQSVRRDQLCVSRSWMGNQGQWSHKNCLWRSSLAQAEQLSHDAWDGSWDLHGPSWLSFWRRCHGSISVLRQNACLRWKGLARFGDSCLARTHSPSSCPTWFGN